MPFAISPERFPQTNDAGYDNGSKPPPGREVGMPARRLSMRKLAEVLRLRFELKLSYEQIAQLLDRAELGPQVSDTSPSSGHRLAAAGRLE